MPKTGPICDENQDTHPADVKRFSSHITDVTERYLNEKKVKGDSLKDISQHEQVLKVFSQIVELEDLQDLRQHHLRHYVDTMALIPTNYGKSPKDRDLHINDIIKRASKRCKVKCGLSERTVNRNLTIIKSFLKRARSEGIALDPLLDLTALRTKRQRHKRKDRESFTAEDVQMIFHNPMWMGHKTKKVRSVPGCRLIKDGKYWVPIIAALSGLRREEIAALRTSEVVLIDGIYCFDIKENENRGLKNIQSERQIPLHDQLIDLGFLEYVKRRKRGNLFPELAPTASNKNTPFGDKIDYLFRKVVKMQVSEPAKKTFHSFRHYVADVLNNDPDVKDGFRDDLLGHEGKSMVTTTYGSGTKIQNLQWTVNRLPRIQVLDRQKESLST